MQACSEALKSVASKLLSFGVGIIRYRQIHLADMGLVLVFEWLVGKSGARSTSCALTWDSDLPTDAELVVLGELAVLAFRRMAYVAVPADKLALCSNPFIFQKTSDGQWKMSRAINGSDLMCYFGTGLLKDFGQIIRASL
jgi:hypothetical protein